MNSFNRVLKKIWPLLLTVTLILILLYGLGAAKIPLALSFALAYLMFPLIKKLEMIGIKRQYAVIAVFVLILLFFVGFTILFIPPLIDDLREFVQRLPELIDRSLIRLELFLVTWGIHIQLDRETVVAYVRESLQSLDIHSLAQSSDWIRQAAGQIIGSLLLLLKLFLIPVFFFYLIMDWELTTRRLKDLIPSNLKKSSDKLFNEVDLVLSGYIRGQLLVALSLAALYSIGLAISGLPFALIVGLTTGFLSIIPYVGVAVGLSISLAICIADFDLSVLLSVLATFGIIQVLESFLITPRLVGNRVGLNSLESLLALIIGGNLMGFFGMLLAIPSGAILKKIFAKLIKLYQKTELFE